MEVLVVRVVVRPFKVLLVVMVHQDVAVVVAVAQATASLPLPLLVQVVQDLFIL
jgi:hypothetical protein